MHAFPNVLTPMAGVVALQQRKPSRADVIRVLSLQMQTVNLDAVRHLLQWLHELDQHSLGASSSQDGMLSGLLREADAACLKAAVGSHTKHPFPPTTNRGELVADIKHGEPCTWVKLCMCTASA
jgi:hypothetical protein